MLDKKKVLENLKSLSKQHEIEAKNWSNMKIYSAAWEHSIYAQVYRNTISEIESGQFDIKGW
jgi:hypothetical protein